MSANTLKIIALIAMTIDHAGLMLFPEYEWMRLVGGIAFPIFAFMIAEGCRYTRNRLRYLLQIALLGIGMQIVSFVVVKSLYQSVFISFTLAIILIYVLDKAKDEQKMKYWIYAGLVILATTFLCLGLPEVLDKTDYDIDYNIVGIWIPVVCYFAKSKKLRLFVFTVGLLALSAFYGGIQWFCLLAIPLIGMYNYQRGRFRLKKLFYLYYPAHLCVIFAIGMFVNR